MTVGERIKRRRLELNLSGDDLAKAIGVSRSTLFRYESGAIEKISIQKFQLLAQVLQIQPEDLLGWQSEESTETAIYKLIPQLSKRQQDQLYNYTQRLLSDRSPSNFLVANDSSEYHINENEKA